LIIVENSTVWKMIGELFLLLDEYKDSTINFTDEENNVIISFKLHSMVLKNFSEYFKSNENFKMISKNSEKCINWGPEEQKYVSIEAFRIIIDHWYEIKKSYKSETKNVLNEILKSACDYLQCDLIVPQYDLLFPYEIIIKSFQAGDDGYLLYVDLDNNINTRYTKHVGKMALQKLADLAGIRIEELRIEQYKYITFKNKTYTVNSFSNSVTRLNEILEDYISCVYYDNFHSTSL